MSATNRDKVIERARKKIIANINYIYENLNVEKKIIKIRKKFIIPDNFFVDYKILTEMWLSDCKTIPPSPHGRLKCFEI